MGMHVPLVPISDNKALTAIMAAVDAVPEGTGGEYVAPGDVLK
jgi:hypothetical protein